MSSLATVTKSRHHRSCGRHRCRSFLPAPSTRRRRHADEHGEQGRIDQTQVRRGISGSDIFQAVAALELLEEQLDLLSESVDRRHVLS